MDKKLLIYTTQQSPKATRLVYCEDTVLTKLVLELHLENYYIWCMPREIYEDLYEYLYNLFPNYPTNKEWVHLPVDQVNNTLKFKLRNYKINKILNK